MVDWSGSARLQRDAKGQVRPRRRSRGGSAPARGKRASGAEINHTTHHSKKQQSLRKQPYVKKAKEAGTV
jgi:hypothetical protein